MVYLEAIRPLSLLEKRGTMIRHLRVNTVATIVGDYKAIAGVEGDNTGGFVVSPAGEGGRFMLPFRYIDQWVVVAPEKPREPQQDPRLRGII